MKHPVFLILFFLFLSFSIAADETIDSTIFKNASLIIVKKEIVHELVIKGDVIFTNKCIYFNPRNNKCYVNKITIPIDDIDQIYNSFKGIYFNIKMKNGCNYKIAYIKKKKLLKSLDNLVKDPPLMENIDKNTFTQEYYTTKIKMPFWTSIYFLPFSVKGVIEKNENSVIFKPVEFGCYIKNISINKNQVKKLKKKFKHKLIVELKSGEKYRFITYNRDQLINDLQ